MSDLKLLNNMKHAEDYLKEQACGSQDGEDYHAAETMHRAANKIAALEKKLSDTDFRYKMALHVSGFTENQINEFILEEQSHS